jgi:hypothetical protein
MGALPARMKARGGNDLWISCSTNRDRTSAAIFRSYHPWTTLRGALSKARPIFDLGPDRLIDDSIPVTREDPMDRDYFRYSTWRLDV